MCSTIVLPYCSSLSLDDVTDVMLDDLGGLFGGKSVCTTLSTNNLSLASTVWIDLRLGPKANAPY